MTCNHPVNDLEFVLIFEGYGMMLGNDIVFCCVYLSITLAL